MGYTTEFYGKINVTPPLNEDEITYLRLFNKTRRMDRKKGPYFVGGKGDYGQDKEEDVRDYNQPPKGQPGLWCQWVPSEDGSGIEWDGNEKFYESEEWMAYIIDHFLKPGAIAKTVEKNGSVKFVDHVCNGVIEAQGEDRGDIWKLVVKDNKVQRVDGYYAYADEA